MNRQDHRVLPAHLPPDRLHQEPVDVPSVRAFERHALDGHEVQFFPELFVQMCEPSFVATVHIGHIQVVEVHGVVHGVREAARLFVDVDEVHRSFTRCDRRRATRCEIDAIQLGRSFHAALEVHRLTPFGPSKRGRNQVEAVDGLSGPAASARRRQPYLWMPALFGRARKRNGLPVGRPARRVVGLGVIRDLRQRPARCVDHPHVGVAALVERLACAVGHERNLLPVGRPLRIAVVPIVARRDLRRLARRCVDDPEVRARVVEPAGVVEFVIEVLVVADVARRLGGVARPEPADRDETRAVRRPREARDAARETRQLSRFAARQ